MNKLTFISGAIALVLASSIVASCDDAEEGIRYNQTVFPVGLVEWNGVNSEDQEVITRLINKMTKVEQCQFYMGAQSRSTSRANYFTGFATRDTIWCKNGQAFTRNLKSQDTVWYHADDYHFVDTIKTKYDTISFAVVYKNGPSRVGPVIEVSMPDYYIGKYEVTQEEWMAVMHKEPTGRFSILPDAEHNASWYDEFGKGADIAAYNVWYQDAVEFCDSLKSKTGLNFRLPTEAEWECAARGGRYCHGYRFVGSDDLYAAGWVHGNTAAQKIGSADYGVHKGGEKEPNELGLYDMNGNVSEWVANSYYLYGRKDTINPQGNKPLLNGQDTLVLRGGSWMQSKYVDFSAANRKICIMSSFSTEESRQSAFFNCGFRLCITPQ